MKYVFFCYLHHSLGRKTRAVFGVIRQKLVCPSIDLTTEANYDFDMIECGKSILVNTFVAE